MISDADLRQLERQLPNLDPEHKRRVLELLEERDRLAGLADAREHFLAFVRLVWPEFIPGAHHQLMAEAFEDVAAGRLNRLIIDMPPRFTKSQFASWLLPAWFLGRFPSKKIIQASNTESLAAGFGRQVRNLVSREDKQSDDPSNDNYHEVFPDVTLAKDSQAAGHWHTNKGGSYFAVGVNGRVTGIGGDIILIDDPHALEITTEIPTPNGFVTIADLKIGDEVFGPDGKPTKILAKSAVMHDRLLYDATTNDGATVACDAGHLWTYRRGTNVKLGFTTGETRVLEAWDKPNKPIIPSTRPVEYPHADLPIDPYCLGYWLGNGTATLGRITCHLDDVAYIRAQFDAAGYETTDQVDPHNFGVKGIRAQTMAIGVFDNKHIPDAYLTASVEQRMALLNGLMDSDGTVAKLGQCSFDNTNLNLVEGVRQLVHSFGVRCSPIKLIPPSPTGYKTEQPSLYYRTNFNMENAARIPRKRERTRSPTDKRGRSITVTKALRKGSVQCITVDREDGLFLAGRGYIVTHNSEQEAKQAESRPEVFDDVTEWFTSGPRQRLQPGGAIIIVATRWSKRDLVGQVLKKMDADIASGMRPGTYDHWKVINLPAILDEGESTERSMWPAFWPLETLQATRNALPVGKWSAQYQQNPVSEQAAILKREYWRRWGDDDKERCPGPMHAAAWQNGDPPACDYIIGSWDCASTKNERSHPSAYTLWGVFKAEDPDTGKTVNNIILLSSFTARMEFPELKKRAKEFYDEDNPDTLLIENKAAGIQLLQEFRAMGIPAEDFSGSSRGTKSLPNDKIARANMVVDIFASKYVWAPNRRFADVVIEECASFPAGDTDDLVDSAVQAMIRFRQGGFIRTANDEPEEEPVRRHRKRYY